MSLLKLFRYPRSSATAFIHQRDFTYFKVTIVMSVACKGSHVRGSLSLSLSLSISLLFATVQACKAVMTAVVDLHIIIQRLILNSHLS